MNDPSGGGRVGKICNKHVTISSARIIRSLAEGVQDAGGCSLQGSWEVLCSEHHPLFAPFQQMPWNLLCARPSKGAEQGRCQLGSLVLRPRMLEIESSER